MPTTPTRLVVGQRFVTISDIEIALSVIPEGSEFLMRWRYSDLRR